LNKDLLFACLRTIVGQIEGQIGFSTCADILKARLFAH